MGHTPHELAEEFPEYVEKISELKESNAHFARMFDEYHEVNRAVHQAESNVVPTDQFNEAEIRKKRMLLKDQIWALISAK